MVFFPMSNATLLSNPVGIILAVVVGIIVVSLAVGFVIYRSSPNIMGWKRVSALCAVGLTIICTMIAFPIGKEHQEAVHHAEEANYAINQIMDTSKGCTIKGNDDVVECSYRTIQDAIPLKDNITVITSVATGEEFVARNMGNTVGIHAKHIDSNDEY